MPISLHDMLHTFPMSVYFKKTLTQCCHLPKQSTCPLYLFCLLYLNSQILTTTKPPHENFHCSNSQMQFPYAERIINLWENGNLRCHPLLQKQIGPCIRTQISRSMLTRGNTVNSATSIDATSVPLNAIHGRDAVGTTDHLE